MRRIVHICLSGQYIDGWGYQENLLPAYLQEEGTENIVVCSSNVFPPNVPAATVRDIKARGDDYYCGSVRIVRIRTVGISSSLAIAPKLFRTLKELSPDVVFHHDVIFSTLVPAVRFSSRHGAVLLVDNHADDLNVSSNPVWRFVYHRILNRLACRLADRTVRKYYGVSPLRCDFLKEQYGIPDSKIALLPIGADVREADRLASKQDLRAEYGFGESDRIVVSGGKMGAGKGTDTLIKAVEGSGRKLILFGSFTDERTREMAAGSSSTTVFGWCDRRKALELLKLADLACWPVHHTTLYEDAVSVGTPLLVRRSGNAGHLVAGNGGWTSTDTLREDIDRFFTTDMQAASEAAAAVRDRISYTAVAGKILEDIEKPKVLFILHLPPPVHGAAMVGQYIKDSGQINSRFDTEFINLATAKSLEDIGSLRLSKLTGFISLYRRVITSLRRDRKDLVYITPNAKGISFFKEYLLVMKIKRMGVKVIAHYHNKGVSTWQDNRLYDRMYRRFFKGLKVILLSWNLYPDIEKYVSREDVFICPNGIPALPEGEACPKPAVPHILFLSNLLPGKGPLVLLDALKILSGRGYKYACDVVGGETHMMDRAFFEAETDSRGLSGVVVYHGRKYGEEKEAFLRAADIFVFPSRDECFPLVLLEAMQHSLPVVTTPVGGIPDIVVDGETGLLVDAADVAGLADSLARLLDDAAMREEMGRKGYERYRTSFTRDIWESRLVRIIDENIK